MNKNVGSIDRALRLVIAAALFAVFFMLEGGIRYVGLLGLVPAATALIGYCPLYSLLGLRTCPLE